MQRGQADSDLRASWLTSGKDTAHRINDRVRRAPMTHPPRASARRAGVPPGAARASPACSDSVPGATPRAAARSAGTGRRRAGRSGPGMSETAKAAQSPAEEVEAS